jgi:hypothetical protein
LEPSYTGKAPTSAGVWDGDMPAAVAPGEHEKRDASPPDAPSDTLEAEPDEALEKPTG